jgi:hypothetical protein
MVRHTLVYFLSTEEILSEFNIENEDIESNEEQSVNSSDPNDNERTAIAETKNDDYDIEPVRSHSRKN